MILSQLLKVLDESNLTAEQFGKKMGISGMTIRRWSLRPKSFQIPAVYVPAIREACYQLITEKHLNPESQAVKSILESDHHAAQQAALSNLGLKKVFNPSDAESEDLILSGLKKIGLQERKQTQVDQSSEKFHTFSQIGKEWRKRITSLWDVISSKKITFPDKVIAYGALFYLITPIDFIPDHLPMVGLMDDFLILGVAVSHYSEKLKGLSKL